MTGKIKDAANVAEPTPDEVESLISRLERDASKGGYNLNPDRDFVRGLARGLLINERRYGYMACPCRLASGERGEDLDIICPCNYRDADVSESGACYCALYVSSAVQRGEKELAPVPERRPPEEIRMKTRTDARGATFSGASPELEPLRLSLPVWRCTVCGYLCARDSPPDVCPICKVSKDRFERFL